jgi:spermidine dehydrogenase
LNEAVDIGGDKSVRSPDEPILVRMLRTPAKYGLPEREQHKAGRAELLATPLETFERQIREQLGRALGSGGFDPARDIAGIAVNRWPHGYAPEYNFLVDGDMQAGTNAERDRPQRLGRIAIANSDAGMGAYTTSRSSRRIALCMNCNGSLRDADTSMSVYTSWGRAKNSAY